MFMGATRNPTIEWKDENDDVLNDGVISWMGSKYGGRYPTEPHLRPPSRFLSDMTIWQHEWETMTSLVINRTTHPPILPHCSLHTTATTSSLYEYDAKRDTDDEKRPVRLFSTVFRQNTCTPCDHAPETHMSKLTALSKLLYPRSESDVMFPYRMGSYDLTIAVHTVGVPWKVIAESKQRDSRNVKPNVVANLECSVAMISVLINRNEVRIYRNPECTKIHRSIDDETWRHWRLPSSGWLPQFKELMNGARYIHAWDVESTYGLLRSVYPYESMYMPWVSKTRFAKESVMSAVRYYMPQTMDKTSTDSSSGMFGVGEPASGSGTGSQVYLSFFPLQSFFASNPKWEGVHAQGWHFDDCMTFREYNKAEMVALAELHMIARVCRALWEGAVGVVVNVVKDDAAKETTAADKAAEARRRKTEREHAKTTSGSSKLDILFAQDDDDENSIGVATTISGSVSKRKRVERPTRLTSVIVYWSRSTPSDGRM